MRSPSDQVLRTYLTLVVVSTSASSMIWGINTLFLLDAGLSIGQAFAANAFFAAFAAGKLDRTSIKRGSIVAVATGHAGDSQECRRKSVRRSLARGGDLSSAVVLIATKAGLAPFAGRTRCKRFDAEELHCVLQLAGLIVQFFGRCRQFHRR